MSDEPTPAEYYEAHKDDPDEWDEPEPAKPRRRRASMISVRLAPADERTMSVSAFLRFAALNEAQTRHSRLPVLPLVVTQAPRHRPGAAVTMLAAPENADISKMGETFASTGS